MSAERDRVIAERFVSDGNLAAGGLLDPDHVDQDPTAPEVGRGSMGVKEVISTYREAFPDSRFHVGEKIEVPGVETNHVRKCVLSTVYPRSREFPSGPYYRLCHGKM